MKVNACIMFSIRFHQEAVQEEQKVHDIFFASPLSQTFFKKINKAGLEPNCGERTIVCCFTALRFSLTYGHVQLKSSGPNEARQALVSCSETCTKNENTEKNEQVKKFGCFQSFKTFSLNSVQFSATSTVW